MWSARKIIVFALLTLVMISSAAWLGTITRGREQPSTVNSGSDPLVDLERRITALEKVGPFIVTDKQGKEIFTVESLPNANVARVFNSKGVRVASFGSDELGGYFKAVSADESRSGHFYFDKTFAGLSFLESVPEKVDGDDELRIVKRLDLGRGEGGNYSLRVNGKSEEQIAGIGESKAGSGAIVVGDPQVSKRASITVGDGDKGIIGIFTGDGNAVAAFGEAVGNNGGSLVLGDAKSEPRVKIGTNNLRYGVVLTLPQGLPYVPRSGLPGSYLLGCAGGPSCVP